MWEGRAGSQGTGRRRGWAARAPRSSSVLRPSSTERERDSRESGEEDRERAEEDEAEAQDGGRSRLRRQRRRWRGGSMAAIGSGACSGHGGRWPSRNSGAATLGAESSAVIRTTSTSPPRARARWDALRRQPWPAFIAAIGRFRPKISPATVVHAHPFAGKVTTHQGGSSAMTTCSSAACVTRWRAVDRIFGMDEIDWKTTRERGGSRKISRRCSSRARDGRGGLQRLRAHAETTRRSRGAGAVRRRAGVARPGQAEGYLGWAQWWRGRAYTVEVSLFVTNNNR